MRLGWDWTCLVRGLCLFRLRFFKCLGVLVMRKEVENERNEGFGSEGKGRVRVLVSVELGLLLLVSMRRQAMEFWI